MRLETLLHTKFNIPQQSPNLISRPHLLQKLDRGLQLGARITIISAPAGFGKTTIISEWVHQQDRPVAWLSIDEGDNDISRFFEYFNAALQSIGLNIAEGVPVLPKSTELPPVQVILTPLINAISALQDPFLLVLDDYHAIETPFIHESLDFLVSFAPPQLHLVITTRVDPPLSLSRLRGRGQLTEIRASDLRFGSEEVAAYLNTIMGLDLSTEDIDKLETRTEGWIAGLQMAAIAMQNREDITGFVTAFSGSNDYIIGYLSDEVLAHQSAEMQNFLLQTSILDRMTGPLCDELTGRKNGEQTLEQLKNSNLFIIPLDDVRQWYRYHHLFGELLRGRLKRDNPDHVLVLHAQAAQWYANEGYTWDAVEHALKANDFDLAADILERLGKRTELWRYIQVGTLLRWFQTIPSTTVRNRPWLRLYAARAYAHAGQVDKGEEGLRELEALLESSPEAVADAKLMSERILGNQAVYAAFRGHCKKAIDIAHKALDRSSEENILVRTRATSALGHAYSNLGDVKQASLAIQKSINLSISAGVWSSVVGSTYRLAVLQIVEGKLRLATQTCQEARKWSFIDGKRIPADGLLCLPLGEILYEQNQLIEAQNQLQEDLHLLGQHEITDYFGSGYALLARVKQGLGDSSGALDLIQRAKYIAETSNLPIFISKISAIQAQIWLSQGKLTQAARWAQEYPKTEKTECLREFEELVLIRVFVANNQSDKAIQRLNSLLPLADEAGRMGRVITMLMLRSLAFYSKDDIESSLLSLEQALNLAEPEGYIRTFVDEGQPMARLLYEAVDRDIAPVYVQKLLRAFPAEEPKKDDTKKLQESELIEPLSEREIEVLQLMAKGLTNQVIATRLYLSVHTVKVHARNIYGKLDVENRTQAVARGRALGILSSN